MERMAVLKASGTSRKEYKENDIVKKILEVLEQELKAAFDEIADRK